MVDLIERKRVFIKYREVAF